MTARLSSAPAARLEDDGSRLVFVARQPILDRRQRLAAYELLFRSGPENVFSAIDGDLASRSVLGHSLNTFGLADLTQGRRAYINFTRSLLERETALMLPPTKVVIEILETVAPDLPVLQACRALKQAGYQLALDDVVALSPDDPLLEFAHIVKVDFLQTNGLQRRAIAQTVASRHLTLLAEKVETRDDFAEAIQLGYTLFQGYFFQKPEIVSRRDVPAGKLASLQLLADLNEPDPDWERLEQIMKQDVGLPVKLLRYLNSTWIGLSRRVDSLRHALILLGVQPLRQWASLVVVTDLGRDRPPELVTLCLLRAKMCERLATVVSLPESASNLFLVGLFSSLDALVGRPLDELLDDLAVPEEVRDALLGPPNQLGDIYRLVLAYKRGDWPDVSNHARILGIDETVLPAIYAQSVAWVTQIAPLAQASQR